MTVDRSISSQYRHCGVTTMPHPSVDLCMWMASLMPKLLRSFILQAVSMVGVYLFANPDDPTRRSFTWGELGTFSSITWGNNFWWALRECLASLYPACLDYCGRMGTACSFSHHDGETDSEATLQYWDSLDRYCSRKSGLSFNVLRDWTY